ncbi:MAG: phosphate regulon sensor histidine kinase PhoR [Hydrogenophilales bacterium 28-61-23]|nr:MAG: phosphate regulon sensor histidine kinase PhoR [Hydrogenophilales bacterium 28-61-23]
MLAFWWRPLMIFLGLALVSIALAIAFSTTLGCAFFSAVLFVYLLYHIYHLHKLSNWLAAPVDALLQGDGAWGDVFYRLAKLLRGQQAEQQKALADLEQMHEATRHLPDGVVILDDDNRINWLNDAAEHLLGLSQNRDAGQFVLYLMRNSRFSEWLHQEDFTRRLTIEASGARGKTVSLQLISLPREQKMLVARDITDIARVDTMRRDFVANVSHELRTPITVIVGFLEAFEDMPDADPAQLRKHIPLMRAQSDRIRRLVDDLLTLARLESEPETKDETVDMVSLAQRLAREAESLSQGKHQIELKLDNQARLIGNSQELYSALANLVSNAVRYTPANGLIRIKWGLLETGEQTFSVQDSGEGIDPQHIPRLTERFYRVDQGRSRATGGTGLGLAIVKHVLQRHQAKLRVESTVGKGSTFSAVFPTERVIPEIASTLESESESAA